MTRVGSQRHSNKKKPLPWHSTSTGTWHRVSSKCTVYCGMFNTCRILTRSVPTLRFTAHRFITSGTVPSQADVVMNSLIAGHPLCSSLPPSNYIIHVHTQFHAVSINWSENSRIILAPPNSVTYCIRRRLPCNIHIHNPCNLYSECT